MITDWRREHLPCGTALADLVTQVCDGQALRRSAHQRACRYCAAVLHETAQLWVPVRSAAGQDVEVPDRLVGTVMRRVRRLVQAGWLTVRSTRYGLTRVSGWVVAAIAQAAGEQTPGVRRVACSLGSVTRLPEGVTRAGVELDVVTHYGPSILDVTGAVRANVVAQVSALTEIETVDVRISVPDIHAVSGSSTQPFAGWGV